MPLKGEFVIDKSKEENPSLQVPTQDASKLKSEQNAPQENSMNFSHSLHPFTSLCKYPEGVVFQNQDADEKIILLVRRDFATNIPWILGLIALSLLPLLILPFLPSLLPPLSLSKNVLTYIVFFYYLILFGLLLVNFSIWYFNAALITNKRIIDLDVTGILFRNVAETNLDLIQDVSYTQIGSIRSLLDYGDILIQTAGDKPNFELDRAPMPAEIVNIIGSLIGKEK